MLLDVPIAYFFILNGTDRMHSAHPIAILAWSSPFCAKEIFSMEIKMMAEHNFSLILKLRDIIKKEHPHFNEIEMFWNAQKSLKKNYLDALGLPNHFF